MGAPAPATESTPHVLRRDADGVTTLTLNRGDRLNPLSSAMLSALQAALDAVAADGAVRVVVLAAAGRHFCAGHDLREMRAHPEEAWQARLFAQCSHLMLSLVRLPQPVVARVHGAAAAAGCQLVAMCDLAVASDTAQFALPGVKSGLFCTTPGVAVSRNLPRKRAMEMLLTGDPVDARTAERWGLVNRVVPAAELDGAVEALARRIAGHSRAVTALGKRLFYEQAECGLADAYARAGDAMVCNMGLPDAAEGIEAFLAKREPVWQGR
jgi:enoyl-CoA hydratase/carnithine racemase